MITTADTAAAPSPGAAAEHAREHVAVPAPPPSSPGGQSGFEAFKARVFREPALQGEVIPADFWLMKFYDGYGEEAVSALVRTVQWRKDYGYYNLKDEGAEFADDVASGKLIYYAYSEAGSPILLWRVALHVADAKQIEHTVRFVVWQIERGIRLGMIKDRVSFFLDRAGSSTKNVESAAFFKDLISILQTHFPELLHRMVLFPSNLLLQTVWKVVKPFLDVTVVQKVVMFSPKEYQAGLLSLVDKEHLLTEHGGNCAERLGGDLAVEIPGPADVATPAEAASADSEGDDAGTATIVADSDGPDEELTPVAAESEGDDIGTATIVVDSEGPDEGSTPVASAEDSLTAEGPSPESPGSLTDVDSACDSDVGLLSAAPDTAGAPPAAAAPEPKSKTAAAAPEPKSKTAAAVDSLFARPDTAAAAAPAPKSKSAAIDALSAIRDAAAAVTSGPKAKTAGMFRFWRKKASVE